MYVTDPGPGTDSKHIHRLGCICEYTGNPSYNSISLSCSALTEMFLEKNMQNSEEIRTIYMIDFLHKNVLIFVQIPQDLFTIF